MPQPYRNPDFPEDRRQRYVLKRIVEETAVMERVGTELPARQRSTANIVKNYLARVRKKDHITYLILCQVIFGYRIGVPRTPSERLQIEHACDRTSGIIGEITDGTEAVAIARELDEDPVTKDLEFVVYDARNREDLNDLEEANDIYVATRRRRMEQKIENSNRPISMRRRLLREENDRGIY